MEPNQPLLPTYPRSLDFTSRRSPFAPEASMVVSCIRCRRLHSAVHPFAFNPVCPECASRLRSLGA
jgi:hypothetical protein